MAPVRPPRGRIACGTRAGSRWAALALVVGGVALAAPPASAQGCPPFAAGEVLHYTMRVAFGLRIGKGELTVSESDTVRGEAALLLRFAIEVNAGPIHASQRTASWVSPQTLATLRFVKHERSPITDSDDSVEVYPRERRWAGPKGAIGYSPSDLPLDELSFLYFLRTLPLGPDSSWNFSRHYDPARSPTLVRVLGHELVKTEAGPFEAWKVELKVRDPSHFRGLGRMIVYLADDAQRTPVRIETDMREAGWTVLELSARTAPVVCAARGGNPDTTLQHPSQMFRTPPDAR